MKQFAGYIPQKCVTLQPGQDLCHGISGPISAAAVASDTMDIVTFTKNILTRKFLYIYIFIIMCQIVKIVATIIKIKSHQYYLNMLISSTTLILLPLRMTLYNN